MGSLELFGPHAVLFGLLVIFFINYTYHSHCCIGSAYGDHRPENLSQSGNIPSCFDDGYSNGGIFQLHIPICHPSNELVVGPGGYCFIDYLKVGVPLTLNVLPVLMVTMPVSLLSMP